MLVIGLLLAFRIALPFLVKNYVNKTLDGLDGYTGSVSDVDLNLFRGAYVIDSLNIKMTGDTIPIPFVSIPKTDISVHWRALFDGAIVGEIIFTQPDINFAKTSD
ncbi:MAG TPA: hypothetical protein VKA10_03570, partial [Prolixibacteraceae bacterium]|nr:hypothetical protein [Prolixibacteraceae bacterium]